MNGIKKWLKKKKKNQKEKEYINSLYKFIYNNIYNINNIYKILYLLIDN